MTPPAGIVVLVSGSGTLLQALLDASLDPAYGVRILAVGADRDDIEGLRRAERAGIDTFVCRVCDFPDRGAWDVALAAEIASRGPNLVVTAGFLKILGPRTLAGPPILNTHTALLPSFPGAHAVRDALAHGVRVSGTTVHLVDEGVDTGPIVAQVAVPVEDDDDVETLHERIKVAERSMLVATVGRMAREGYTVRDRKVRFGPATR